MCHTQEELEAGIAAYLAFCHREQTAARASELATFLSVRYRTLRRVCNQVLGVPVNLAIRSRQVDRAARLLRETHLPISEIGRIVGFGDRRTFFRAMRRAFASSPAAIRKGGQIFPSTSQRPELIVP
jgi:AraC family transcriptional activator of pobA